MGAGMQGIPAGGSRWHRWPYRLELPPGPQVPPPDITLSGASAEALPATRAAGLALMPVARLAVGLRREVRCPLHPSCRSRLGPADGLA